MRAVVFAYNILGKVGFESLLRHGYEICALVTHEDDSKEKIYFESVAALAQERGIKVFKPAVPNTPEFIQIIKDLKPDVLFSFYYRQMICEEILNIVNNKAYNLHGSLLPKYRGRSPLNWALIHGETRAGVTLHKMVKKADRGQIVDQQEFEILEEDNISTLQPKMSSAASILLDRALPLILTGKEKLITQDESKASYFGGRKASDGIINWELGAQEINNLIRAVTDPFPGAFTFYNGKKIIIWSAKVLPSSAEDRPGRILSLCPLTISTGKGILSISTGKVGELDHLTAQEIVSEAGLSQGVLLS